jgi:putative phosphoribosyl transferase
VRGSTLRRPETVVLGLARGGIPIGYEVALALHAPLDVVLVRKIGVPWQRELALGAIVDGETPETVVDEGLVNMLAIPRANVDEEIERQSRRSSGGASSMPRIGRRSTSASPPASASTACSLASASACWRPACSWPCASHC